MRYNIRNQCNCDRRSRRPPRHSLNKSCGRGEGDGIDLVQWVMEIDESDTRRGNKLDFKRTEVALKWPVRFRTDPYR